jgi:hypothetical protein
VCVCERERERERERTIKEREEEKQRGCEYLVIPAITDEQTLAMHKYAVMQSTYTNDKYAVMQSTYTNDKYAVHIHKRQVCSPHTQTHANV